MDTMTKRDSRGQEIKRLLAKHYPAATFRVRIHKYSMGKSIHVQTNLLQEILPTVQLHGETVWLSALDCKANRQETLTGEEWDALWAYRKAIKARHDQAEEIKRVLSGYESIDRDSATGEILSGGNTYLFVECL